MSQTLLGSCPLHHRPFEYRRLHRRLRVWQGSALFTQKTGLPSRSRALTWTVHAKKPPTVLNECVPYCQDGMLLIAFICLQCCRHSTRYDCDWLSGLRSSKRSFLPTETHSAASQAGGCSSRYP